MRHAGSLAVFRLVALVVMAALLAGCAASRAFNRGNEAAQVNEWEVAIDQYRQALQREPDNVTYRIALQRALINASQYWSDQARIAEAREQLEEALAAYRRANQFDPGNRQLSARISELERRIRGGPAQVPDLLQQQQQAAQPAQPIGGPPALIRLDERLPTLRFGNANARDVLTSIGNVAGINVTFERDFPPTQAISVELIEVTLEEALNQIMAANQLFYKVLNERTILVIQDTQPKRLQYDDQIVRVIRLAHADATELQGMINSVVRVPGNIQLGTNWQIIANKTQNTLTYRAPASVAAVIDQLVAASDKPRAEIIVDVEVLEVNRTRIKQYGLDLGSYAIGATLAPEGLSDDPFSLRSLTRGVGQDDLFLTVPSAVVRFLEQDSETKLLARPQLRGAEGQEITLELGEEVPIPSTVFQPLAQGGANFQPLSSFNYRPVGIIVTMTPTRVTPDGEIVLDLTVENSTRGGDVNISGSNLPTFSTRRASAVLRLRDGETNMLAGLIQENDRRQLRGIPGILRLPVIKQLFSANDSTIQQTDIIILLTPRVVRTHELTPRDLDPIIMRTPTTLGLGTSPSIVQPPLEPAPPAGPQPGAPGGQPQPPAPPPPQGGAVPPPAPGAGPGGGAGRILLTPNATDLRAGTDGLLVPVTAEVSRLSRVSLTVTYNPAVLRVRTVQQGSFLTMGGGAVTFTENHDTPGRIDIAMIRTGDQTGATGVGQLAAILFDTIAAGAANLNITGTAADPKGVALPVDFMQSPPVTAR